MKNKPKLYCEETKMERLRQCYKKNSMGDYFFRFLIKLNKKNEKKVKKEISKDEKESRI